MGHPEAPWQRYKLSAVRRPSGAFSSIRERRVTDEEIVHELWTRQPKLEQQLTARVGGAVGAPVAVKLTAIDDSAGVLCQLEVSPPEVKAGRALPDLSPAVIAAVSAVLETGLGGPVAVSASPEPPKIEEPPESKETTAWNQVAPVLAFIAAGIGVIGFVTFVGGAVVWARLNAAGFPAAPALGIFPSQDLLVIGAETLVPQVIVALVVVIALTLLYTLAILVVRLFHRGASDTMLSAAALARPGGSAVAMFCFISVALAVMLVAFSGDLDTGQIWRAALVAIVCALLAAVAGSGTRSLVYLAVTSFVLAGVFDPISPTLARAATSASGAQRSSATT